MDVGIRDKRQLKNQSEDLRVSIRETNEKYNSLKGEILAVHDSVINRDTSTLSMQLVQGVRETQREFQNKLKHSDQQIQLQSKQADDLKK